MKHNKPVHAVPGLYDIQKALVAMCDKPTVFEGSRDWIGTIEVGLCIDYFYDVSIQRTLGTNDPSVILIFFQQSQSGKSSVMDWPDVKLIPQTNTFLKKKREKKEILRTLNLQ